MGCSIDIINMITLQCSGDTNNVLTLVVKKPIDSYYILDAFITVYIPLLYI